MNEDFDQTLNNNSRFTTYSLAMTALVKSARVLKLRGADPKAISFILSGIDHLVHQLETQTRRLQNRKFVDDFLKELRGVAEDER